MTGTKISEAYAADPITVPLATDMFPLARAGEQFAYAIQAGAFLANAPATTFLNAHTFAAGLISSGNVGIGIAEPLERLHVVSSGRGIASLAGSVSNVSNIDGLLVTQGTGATVNGSNDLFGISSQLTGQTISAGVTDAGLRVAITGDAYSALSAFAGTLNLQAGIRGRAGFVAATPGAVVTNAYGGYFEIKNAAAGATITNAFGVYINNGETVGTITNRWDLYAASILGKSYFAGQVGIGTAPNFKLDIATAVSNDRGLNVYNTGTGSQQTGIWSEVAGAASKNVAGYFSATGAALNYGLLVVGLVGIGTLTPKSALHVVGLPIYANNAAAVSGGLTAGAFYRSNADPDIVCVVH